MCWVLELRMDFLMMNFSIETVSACQWVFLVRILRRIDEQLSNAAEDVVTGPRPSLVRVLIGSKVPFVGDNDLKLRGIVQKVVMKKWLDQLRIKRETELTARLQRIVGLNCIRFWTKLSRLACKKNALMASKDLTFYEEVILRHALNKMRTVKSKRCTVAHRLVDIQISRAVHAQFEILAKWRNLTLCMNQAFQYLYLKHEDNETERFWNLWAVAFINSRRLKRVKWVNDTKLMFYTLSVWREQTRLQIVERISLSFTVLNAIRIWRDVATRRSRNRLFHRQISNKLVLKRRSFDQWRILSVHTKRMNLILHRQKSRMFAKWYQLTLTSQGIRVLSRTVSYLPARLFMRKLRAMVAVRDKVSRQFARSHGHRLQRLVLLMWRNRTQRTMAVTARGKLLSAVRQYRGAALTRRLSNDIWVRARITRSVWTRLQYVALGRLTEAFYTWFHYLRSYEKTKSQQIALSQNRAQRLLQYSMQAWGRAFAAVQVGKFCRAFVDQSRRLLALDQWRMHTMKAISLRRKFLLLTIQSKKAILQRCLIHWSTRFVEMSSWTQTCRMAIKSRCDRTAYTCISKWLTWTRTRQLFRAKQRRLEEKRRPIVLKSVLVWWSERYAHKLEVIKAFQPVIEALKTKDKQLIVQSWRNGVAIDVLGDDMLRYGQLKRSLVKWRKLRANKIRFRANHIYLRARRQDWLMVSSFTAWRKFAAEEIKRVRYAKRVVRSQQSRRLQKFFNLWHSTLEKKRYLDAKSDFLWENALQNLVLRYLRVWVDRLLKKFTLRCSLVKQIIQCQTRFTAASNVKESHSEPFSAGTSSSSSLSSAFRSAVPEQKNDLLFLDGITATTLRDALTYASAQQSGTIDQRQKCKYLADLSQPINIFDVIGELFKGDSDGELIFLVSLHAVIMKSARVVLSWRALVSRTLLQKGRAHIIRSGLIRRLGLQQMSVWRFTLEQRMEYLDTGSDALIAHMKRKVILIWTVCLKIRRSTIESALSVVVDCQLQMMRSYIQVWRKLTRRNNQLRMNYGLLNNRTHTLRIQRCLSHWYRLSIIARGFKYLRSGLIKVTMKQAMCRFHTLLRQTRVAKLLIRLVLNITLRKYWLELGRHLALKGTVLTHWRVKTSTQISQKKKFLTLLPLRQARITLNAIRQWRKRTQLNIISRTISRQKCLRMAFDQWTANLRRVKSLYHGPKQTRIAQRSCLTRLREKLEEWRQVTRLTIGHDVLLRMKMSATLDKWKDTFRQHLWTQLVINRLEQARSSRVMNSWLEYSQDRAAKRAKDTYKARQIERMRLRSVFRNWRNRGIALYNRQKLVIVVLRIVNEHVLAPAWCQCREFVENERLNEQIGRLLTRMKSRRVTGTCLNHWKALRKRKVVVVRIINWVERAIRQSLLRRGWEQMNRQIYFSRVMDGTKRITKVKQTATFKTLQAFVYLKKSTISNDRLNAVAGSYELRRIALGLCRLLLGRPMMLKDGLEAWRAVSRHIDRGRRVSTALGWRLLSVAFRGWLFYTLRCRLHAHRALKCWEKLTAPKLRAMIRLWRNLTTVIVEYQERAKIIHLHHRTRLSNDYLVKWIMAYRYELFEQQVANLFRNEYLVMNSKTAVLDAFRYNLLLRRWRDEIDPMLNRFLAQRMFQDAHDHLMIWRKITQTQSIETRLRNKRLISIAFRALIMWRYTLLSWLNKLKLMEQKQIQRQYNLCSTIFQAWQHSTIIRMKMKSVVQQRIVSRYLRGWKPKAQKSRNVAYKGLWLSVNYRKNLARQTLIIWKSLLPFGLTKFKSAICPSSYIQQLTDSLAELPAVNRRAVDGQLSTQSSMTSLILERGPPHKLDPVLTVPDLHHTDATVDRVSKRLGISVIDLDDDQRTDARNTLSHKMPPINIGDFIEHEMEYLRKQKTVHSKGSPPSFGSCI